MIYCCLLFSHCHFKVKPRRGDALLFFSLHPTAVPDENSLHAGCPVIEGEKWSATKWIHVDSFDKVLGSAGNCTDTNNNCQRWADLGECTKNPEYMVGSLELPGYCRRSCKVCWNLYATFPLGPDYQENKEKWKKKKLHLAHLLYALSYLYLINFLRWILVVCFIVSTYNFVYNWIKSLVLFFCISCCPCLNFHWCLWNNAIIYNEVYQRYNYSEGIYCQ